MAEKAIPMPLYAAENKEQSLKLSSYSLFIQSYDISSICLFSPQKCEIKYRVLTVLQSQFSIIPEAGEPCKKFTEITSLSFHSSISRLPSSSAQPTQYPWTNKVTDQFGNQLNIIAFKICPRLIYNRTKQKKNWV